MHKAYTYPGERRDSYAALQKRSPRRRKKDANKLAKSLFHFEWDDDIIILQIRHRKFQISPGQFGEYVLNENSLTDNELEVHISKHYVRINIVYIVDTEYRDIGNKVVAYATDENFAFFKEVIGAWCRNYKQVCI